MMMKQGYSTYQTANIDTADQGKLILIAYDVAIKHCKLAIALFEDRKRIEERTKHLFKVQDAITELMCALRLDTGDLAHKLYSLYDYMLRRIVQANAHSDVALVKEILNHLTELRSAWQEAIQVVRTSKAQQNYNPDSGTNLTITG